jgi:hypothetical protein
MARSLFLAVPLAAVVLCVPAAAKDFGPGDLRVCNGQRCVPIVKRSVLPALGAFYYSGPPLKVMPAARMGAPMYQLRFDNGYVTGIVATKSLDRFLSYGVHLERFKRGTWYRVPDGLAREFRRLAAVLRPMRVTAVAVGKSR